MPTIAWPSGAVRRLRHWAALLSVCATTTATTATTARARCARRPAGHPDGNHNHRQRDQRRQPPEQRPPPHQGQCPLHRQRGRHHAQRARHQHPGVGAHLRRGLKPAPIARERRHEAGADPCATQHTPGQQARKPRRHRKHQAAHHGHTQKSQRHLARAMPVQPGAQRQLRGRKAQKVPARKQAQVAGLQRKLLRQCGR